MELFIGVCGICNRESLVLSPKDSEEYQKLIFNYLHEELSISSEHDVNFNLCATCIHHITLLDSKKDLFLENDETKSLETSGKCQLCSENNNICLIDDSNFFNKCKPWIDIEKEVQLCLGCIYLLEVKCTFKEYLLSKLIHQNTSVKTQTNKMARRKSTYQNSNNANQESEDSDLHNLNGSADELEDTIEDSFSHNLNSSISSNSSFDLNSTPVHSKKSRRRKNLNKVMKSEFKQLEVHSKKDLTNFNMFNILKFSPLCKSPLSFDSVLKKDKKMYRYIPFVKMKALESTSINIRKDQCNYVCSLVPQRTMIRMRRTPPIKIKSLKKLGMVKEKKKTVNRKERPIETKKNLIVKLERIKLPFLENISLCESDTKTEEAQKVTPAKKKKRVHFNDTPTIILAEDYFNDDNDEKSKNCESRITGKLRSIMVTEQPKVDDKEVLAENTEDIEDQTDSEELISLVLESESDSEIKETEIGEEPEIPNDKNEHLSENNEESSSENVSENNEEVTENNEENVTDNNEENMTKNNEENLSENKEENSSENNEENSSENNEENLSENNEENVTKNNEENSSENNEENCSENNEENSSEKNEENSSENNEENVTKNNEENLSEKNEENSSENNEENSSEKYEENSAENDEENLSESNEENSAENDYEKVLENNEENLLENFGENMSEDNNEETDEVVAKSLEESDKENDDIPIGHLKDGTEEVPEDNEEKREESALTSEGRIDQESETKSNNSEEAMLNTAENLIKKYCLEDSEHESSNDEKASEEKNATEDAPSQELAPKEDNAENGVPDECSDSPQSEDFGLLIEEVEKCLFTTSNDTEECLAQLDGEADNSNLLEILEESFDDDSADKRESLKRTNSDSEVENPNQKKQKLENC